MAKQNTRDIVFDHFPSTPEFKAGINHLVAIGIDDYKYVAKLSNAVRDAKAFVQLMQEKYDFEAENIYTLYDAEANKKKITETFRELIDKVDKVKDNVIIYFSGHGQYDNVLKEGYWVPVNAKFQAEVDYISYSYIKKVVKAIPSQHTVMIVDSCYSGSVLMGSRDLTAERVEKDPSRWMVASGRNEVVPDGVIGGNSPFAENLLGILDRYSDQGLRLGTLVEKLTTAVSYNSKQTPIGRPMYEVGDQGGEFYFHPKLTPEKAWVKAQQENSEAAYLTFLSKHKGSKFAKDAQAQLAKLQQAATPIVQQAITAEPDAQVAVASPATRSFAAMPTTPAVTPANSTKAVFALSQKQLITYGVVALVVILASIFAFSSHKKNKAERYTLEGKVLLNEGKFAEALDKSEVALLSAHDYDEAKQLNGKAHKGINAQAFFERGQDSLKYNNHEEAIRLFGEALSIYDNISYTAGSNQMTEAIETAKASKIKYEEERAKELAETETEKRLIHEKYQQMQRDSASLYFTQGNYAHALKTYRQLDDTTSIANEIALARLGAAEKLPAMVAVKGHAGGDFYMGKYEVTNEQFCAFLNAIGKHADEQHTFINLNSAYSAIEQKNDAYTVEDANKKRPVTGVSWYGANAYSKWAGGQLPSPEQWKYAARGGIHNNDYAFSGSNKGFEVAVYYQPGDKRPYPAEVGTKKANALGLYDMSGNAWEWSSNSRETSKKQFILGGSINRGETHSQITSDYQCLPSAYGSESNNNDLGFRIIRMAPKQADSDVTAN